MISRTTTRAAVLVGALFSLLVGGFAAVAPPASAEGEVTVTWPEVTAFNPGVYVGLAHGAAFDVRRFTIKLHSTGLR